MKFSIKLLIGIVIIALFLGGCAKQAPDQGIDNKTPDGVDDTDTDNESETTENQTYEEEINKSLDGVDEDVEIGSLV